MPDKPKLPRYVKSLSYDVETKTGKLVMIAGTNCDFEECTSLFERIDPRVKVITTYSGTKLDTSYHRAGRTGWAARVPHDADRT